ncbi:hypothetical protein NBRGN_098_01290 [Nocardia brasiliensis NBRC 14402]|uniref:hypothetical protein n=1 Tax=Nocardia brasiliensis TaxID=37326 RepID=UPI00045CD2FA|nr:hypothetical protein [Nocardia brasiliensis]GAJ85695.1 hypothetical protein NBRGN_098_01290 [Nocardia brasiliensis NBRC 14402]
MEAFSIGTSIARLGRLIYQTHAAIVVPRHRENSLEWWPTRVRTGIGPVTILFALEPFAATKGSAKIPRSSEEFTKYRRHRRDTPDGRRDNRRHKLPPHETPLPQFLHVVQAVGGAAPATQPTCT